MESLTLPNLTNYSIQVAIVAAIATWLAWLLRIDAPSVRYGYWRAVFALCLLLPFVQGRQIADVTAVASVAVAEAHVLENVVPAAVVSEGRFSPWPYVLPLIAAGIGFRLLWLAVSFVRLRRLRKAGAPSGENAQHRELQEWIGVRCEIRYVAGLRQPVTFGVLRPVILLPDALSTRSDAIQRAVLSHELFHVKRRDWGWLLLEEFVCALLWFNPAVWWLVSRLQLAREVVVDELAVLVTGRRRAYVEALMAFADDISLAPVAAFGSRPHLFTRIVMLTKEVGMSSRRLVVTCAVALAVIPAGTWRATGAFPLRAAAEAPQAARHDSPGPVEQRARPITPENPIPRRTIYEGPEYPVEARIANARGTVTVMITLDELGRVAEVRRVALSVVTPTASVQFNNAKAEDMNRFLVNNNQAESDAIRAAALAMQEAAFRAVERWRYEPPASGPMAFPMIVTFALDGEVTAARGRGGAAGATAVEGVRVMGGSIQAGPGAVRVGGNIKPPVKIKDVRPVYPPLAQSARVRGVVIAEVLVGTDGTVQEARILRSIPLLDQAALDAVTQWQFTPTLLNGQAVPVIMTVTVNFTLQDHEQRSPELIKDVKPQYTPEAMRAGIEGSVEIEAVIGTDGTVTNTRVVKGHPMLHDSATAAVQQWIFKPIPEPFTTTIELTFSLRK